MKSNCEKLVTDYINLCKKYEDIMTPAYFASVILLICSKMCYDLAPNHEEADKLIKLNIQTAKEWGLNE